MKKRLTENIDRYDQKLRLSVDKKTAKAAGIALLPAVIILLILQFFLPIFIVAPVAAILFFILFLAQVSYVDGMTMATYIVETVRELLSPGSRIKTYEYTECERIFRKEETTNVPKQKEK